MDEAGCPYCITIDGESLANHTMTVRDRDTMEQSRMSYDQIVAFLDEKVNG
jgi:glycyl-tRNA synthetase